MLERFLLLDSKKRIAYLDYLRLLATILVIAVHTMQTMILDWPPESRTTDFCMVVISYCLSCNVLFPMLSGALLLGGKEEPPFLFYKKRMLRVLVPAVAYYLFYCCYARTTDILGPSYWTFLIREFTANSNGFTPHFWLVHVILMFYISAPFFLVMVRHMDESMCLALAAVILAVQGIFTYAPCVRVEFSATTVMASWETVFLFGYLCTTPALMKRYRLMMAAGIASAVFIVVAVFRLESYGSLIYNHTPVMMLFSAAVFLFFQKHRDGLFSKMPAFLTPFVRYSFSILMIHWYILHFVVGEELGINGNRFGVVGGIPATVFLTLVISLGFSVVFDHVIVFPLEKICRWILDLPKRCKKA